MPVMRHHLIDVTRDEDWRAFHALRRSVLWDARGRDGYRDDHPDDRSPSNHPLLLTIDGQPIGTTRLDERGEGRGVVRLLAIAADQQRQGHGRALSALIDRYARGLRITTLLVNAAPDAVGYYLKMEWRPFLWDAAELTGFAADCQQMSKALD